MKPKRKMDACLIYPDHYLKVMWNFFVTLLVVISCIQTAAMIAFELNDVATLALNYSIDLCFLTDLVLNFFTPYYEDDEYIVIEDHGMIACHYLQGWFAIDLIAIIPFEVLFNF